MVILYTFADTDNKIATTDDQQHSQNCIHPVVGAAAGAAFGAAAGVSVAYGIGFVSSCTIQWFSVSCEILLSYVRAMFTEIMCFEQFD